VINALLGDRYLEEGILPTTNEISVLKFAENGVGSMEQNADGFFVRRLAPLPCRCVMSTLFHMQRSSGRACSNSSSQGRYRACCGASYAVH
jgi:hypothetical protein